MPDNTGIVGSTSATSWGSPAAPAPRSRPPAPAGGPPAPRGASTPPRPPAPPQESEDASDVSDIDDDDSDFDSDIDIDLDALEDGTAFENVAILAAIMIIHSFDRIEFKKYMKEIELVVNYS